MKKRFNWRSFITLSLFFSFSVALISGVALYVAPFGQVGRWIDWHFLWLQTAQWSEIHIVFSFLAAFFASFHLYWLNWRAFWFYIYNHSRKVMNRKIELTVAFAIALTIFVGTAYSVAPFTWVRSFSEYIAELWEPSDYPMPVRHAEDYTMHELAADVVKTPTATVLQRLKNNSIEVKDSTQTLHDVAEQNELSPYEVYKIMVAK